MIEIKRWDTGEVICTVDADTLEGADLRDKNLYRASLVRARLDDASLVGARLVGASLVGATLPTGETWEVYLSEVVPALLRAGGREIAEIVASGAWTCNEWTNCPMAVAFGVQSEAETPLLLRPRVRQFVQLFDAGLIPCPGVTTEEAGR